MPPSEKYLGEVGGCNPITGNRMDKRYSPSIENENFGLRQRKDRVILEYNLLNLSQTFPYKVV